LPFIKLWLRVFAQNLLSFGEVTFQTEITRTGLKPNDPNYYAYVWAYNGSGGAVSPYAVYITTKK
jgi:hypothetical protein